MISPRSVLWLLLPLLMGCEGFFGKRTNIDFLDEPVFDNRTVAYVPILPIWQGLAFPTDIVAGFDELIYVADSGRSEIIAYDESGIALATFPIPGLRAIAQDRQLNILATGTASRVVSGDTLELAAIYRLNLNPSGQYGLQHAEIDTVIVHPTYFRSGDPVFSDTLVRFTGITIQEDNQYYVSRVGPANAASRFGGPDNSIHLFNTRDEWVQNLRISTTLGEFPNYFQAPLSISGLVQPPQPVPNAPLAAPRDFLYVSGDPSTILRVQYIEFREGGDGGRPVYAQRELALNPALADDYLYRPGRFVHPIDVMASEDDNLILVLDAGTDSIYQFTAAGLEGIRPPQGAGTDRNIIVSFGGTGAEPTQFNEPRGVTFVNGVLYVADAGNGRILRFQLTTEFDR